ncbi:MAG TPA: penicillin acylase family protein [Polyangiaceae bacterium]|nr:penicillin acylase family protein [Polyangiaceae bacterium]
MAALMLKRLLGLVLGAREPILSGSIRMRGIQERIILRRDEHGVAYIEAETDADAFFGLGFCQAQDRAFQIELLLRVGRGTLAEIVGPDMLEVDKLSRRIGFARIGVAQLAACDGTTRGMLESFAHGVNAGLEQGRRKRAHELALLGAKPSRFEPWDSLGVLQFLAFALSSNWDAELMRLRILRADGKEALMRLEASLAEWRGVLDASDRALQDVEILAAAEALAAGAAELRAHGAPTGASNNWAIAGSRTASGRPLLASDPHLSPTLPAPWYLAHLRTPEWAMTGACFVTQPVVSIGHNAHGAWAVTAGHADNTDLFVEQLGPDGTSAFDGARFVTCEVREERIRVKGKPDVVERVVVTPRGPIVGPALGEHGDALSLRGTWMAARSVGGYTIFRAENVQQMRACFASYPALSENRLFCDVAGSIAWQMTGDLPVRRRGSALLPAPGWDESAGWELEPLPFEALPHEQDPARGWLASANQRPACASEAGMPFLGVDWLDSYRYDRITELLDARSDWTVDACLAMQLDRHSRLWTEVRDSFLTATEGNTEHELAVARRLLAAWDGNVAPDSAAASVFELALAGLAERVARAAAPHAWASALGTPLNAVLPHGTMPLRRLSHLSRLIREQPDGFFPEGWQREIRLSLAAAVRELAARAGADERRWMWGTVRPLVLRHPFATHALFARMFGLPKVAVGGDATTIPQASVDFQQPLGDPIGIANLRAVIDVGAWHASRWSLAGGQSGNPCSTHFGDLLFLWERGQGITIAWDRADVAGRAHTTLVLERA